jgi:hypothetical protein
LWNSLWWSGRAEPVITVPELIEDVRAYTDSLRIVFALGSPVAGLTLFCSLLIKNIHIEKTAWSRRRSEKEHAQTRTSNAM